MPQVARASSCRTEQDGLVDDAGVVVQAAGQAEVERYLQDPTTGPKAEIDKIGRTTLDTSCGQHDSYVVHDVKHLEVLVQEGEVVEAVLGAGVSGQLGVAEELGQELALA